MTHKTEFLKLVLATMMIAAVVSTVSAQKAPQRIYFARGATVARVTGYLRGINDEGLFVLRAKAGQHMRVEINGRGATRGVVIFPSGKQDGGPGGVVFASCPITSPIRSQITSPVASPAAQSSSA